MPGPVGKDKPRRVALRREKRPPLFVVPESDDTAAPSDGDAVEDSDQDPADWGTDSDGKDDLKLEALSVRHQLTHMPKNKYCPACNRAKHVRTPARRQHRTPEELPKKFGELVNADHVLAQSPEAFGLTGERDALAVVDRYSGFIDAYPLQSNSAEDACASLVTF